MAKPSTVPTFATSANYPASSQPWSAGVTKVQPPAGLIATGYEPEMPPPAQYENWLKNLYGQWLQWMNDTVRDAAISDSLATGTYHNYNPTGLATAKLIRLTLTSGNISFSGLTAPAAGDCAEISFLLLTAGNTVTFIAESGSSVAANRFVAQSDGSGVVLPTTAPVMATWLYDPTSQRWRLKCIVKAVV